MGIEPTDFERFNALVDYFKNLTTLSTWAILLIAAFLEKLFKKPVSRGLVVVSLVGFILCVISSISVHTVVLFRASSPGSTGALVPVGVGAFILGVGGFLVGVVTLAIFAIKNLTKDPPEE